MIILGLLLGMGTSDQQVIGPDQIKRSETLHRPGINDPILIFPHDFKLKRKVPMELSPHRKPSSFAKIFETLCEPIKNDEPGCLPKINLQRTKKLEVADKRGRIVDLITGATKLDRVLATNN